jgi:H+/Cl- antiporter ClcA
MILATASNAPARAGRESTAFVIVLEMTQNAELALPLMAATLIAHAISQTVCPRPLYKALARGFKAAH